MDQLLQLLAKFSHLSPALLMHLRSIIKPRRFKKGEIILDAGTIASHIYFIESGLVRSYYLLEGEDVSNWFMKEGDIFISVLSFFRRIPSMDIHIALEDCVCWGISYEELEEVFRLFPEFDKHGRLIGNEYYCRSEERNILIKRQTPDRKYEILMERDPDLILRVSNEHMASYLDMSPRAYSDVRKAYAENLKKKGDKK